MSPDSAVGFREHFRITVPSAVPVYIGGGSRDVIYIFNEGGPDIRIGNPSGTVSSLGTLLPSGMGVLDAYSDDPWWVQAVSASGTVSGFIVRSG